MALLGAIILLAGVWMAASDLWRRLPKTPAAQLQRWLRNWAIKGLGAPFLLWLFFNSGLSPHFPPLTAQIQMARPGLATFLVFLDVAADGFFIVVSFWAAMTLGWLISVLAERTEGRQQFIQTIVGSSVLPLPVAAWILWAWGWNAAGVAGMIWLLPVYHYVVPLGFSSKTAPLYSRAITKMHSDNYKDAEVAVIEELEKSEEDFQGWMMLAELYANRFGDLAGAERIIRDTCELPQATASEICVAFQRLADWHLKLANDPTAARRDLEEILRRFPDTHMSWMAQMRFNQLPRNREDWIESQMHKPIALPALGNYLDLPTESGSSAIDRKQAAAAANECVRKLQIDPDNTAIREELAKLLAERLDKAPAAIEQIELLLSMPGISADRAAHWMGLLAAWQIKHLGDAAAGRATLERIMNHYPQSAEAIGAGRRISLMDLESKIRAARPATMPSTPKPISITRIAD
jgi:Tetratricopeptide repeat